MVPAKREVNHSDRNRSNVAVQKNREQGVWMDTPAGKLRAMLVPRSIAIVGASERAGALGRFVFENVLAGGFQGPVHAVNPRHESIMGRPCFSSIAGLPQVPDLVVVVTPAAAVAAVVRDAAACKAPGVLVLTAGFGEAGADGKSREREMLAAARAAGTRIIGPNCIGMMRPVLGLNATFARGGARAGTIGLVSQSGAIAAALIDYAWAAGFGFSSVITTGDSSDVEFGELLDFLALDPQTRSIVVYVEGVRKPRQFLSAIRAAASVKPVVVLKAGRQKDGSRAAFSHTGAMAGDDAVFESALRRAGAIRISRYAQLFSASEALSGGRFPRGPRLAIVTNGGGPGVLAADAAADAGLELAGLSTEARNQLDGFLPPTWAHANPVDIVGDSDPRRFARALGTVLADGANDGVLLLFVPTRTLGSEELAQALLPVAAASDKPVVSAWLGEADAARGRNVFKRAGYASLRSPEQGVEAFCYLAQFVRNRELRLQLPPPMERGPEASRPLDIDAARALVASAQARGDTMLAEDEAKSLLAACGIEVAVGQLARSAAQARRLSEEIGFPVVLKVRAEGVVHKSDVGGVLLSLKSPDEVALGFELIRERVDKRAPQAKFTGVLVQRMVTRRSGRELILGIARDECFGPVISFGMGGIAVEVLHDVALALPPLNRVLAADLVSRTRVARMLGPFRGMAPVSMDSLLDAVQRISELACEIPALLELDINPLLADEAGVVALDARVRIGAAPAACSPDPVYSHLAIHPYPRALERELVLNDGSKVLLRPVRPEDAEAQRRFVARLSDLTLYRRFHAPVRELTIERLVRFTQVDYDREMAMVAIDEAGGGEIRGLAQYNRVDAGGGAEFGIAVEDTWQGRGLGYQMMGALEDCARERDVGELFGYVLADNDSMRAMMVARGYAPHREQGEAGIVRYVLSVPA
jgi:acetyltransferase